MDIEGDPNGWHVRLVRRCGDVEIWALYKSNEPQSSPFPKSIVLKWLQQEIDREDVQ